MVSWRRAFGAAGLYVAFLLIWAVIGGIFIFAGIFMAGTLVSYDPVTGIPKLNLAGAGFGVILIIIGYGLILLGSLATFLKIVSEIVAEEVEMKLRSGA
ncbi:MAG TPA: hypothetical protein EYP68_04985 [Candidatus Korarchaeota archaeon]|nr:hypothetical protein [Candidatus Korarchaeota archaeon]